MSAARPCPHFSGMQNPVVKIWLQVLESVARISSDGEKASLLVEMTKHYQEDAALRAAFFKATDSLQSAGESRRVLSALLEKKPAVETLLSVLQSAKTISSDGEKADAPRGDGQGVCGQSRAPRDLP